MVLEVDGREVRDLALDGGATAATLEYSALWCASPTECAPPDPGPPSTWQQAPPVMMVSVYVLLD